MTLVSEKWLAESQQRLAEDEAKRRAARTAEFHEVRGELNRLVRKGHDYFAAHRDEVERLAVALRLAGAGEFTPVDIEKMLLAWRDFHAEKAAAQPQEYFDKIAADDAAVDAALVANAKERERLLAMRDGIPEMIAIGRRGVPGTAARLQMIAPSEGALKVMRAPEADRQQERILKIVEANPLIDFGDPLIATRPKPRAVPRIQTLPTYHLTTERRKELGLDKGVEATGDLAPSLNRAGQRGEFVESEERAGFFRSVRRAFAG